MHEHALPTDPLLREFAKHVNEYWSECHPIMETVGLAAARRLSRADVEEMIPRLLERFFAGEKNAADKVLFLIRAHRIGVLSTTSGEEVLNCEDCGRMYVRHSAAHGVA